MTVPVWFLTVAEQVFNRIIAMDERAARRVGAMAGKSVGLDVRGLNISVLLSFHPLGIALSHAEGAMPNAWIRGAPLSLLRVGLAGDRGAIRDGDVVIEGDLDFGHAVQRWLRELDVDWEESLSRLTGDPLAHRVGSLWRRAREQTVRHLGETARDGAEYLRDELAVAPFAHESEQFYRGVDTLRGDTDRLAQRIAQLETRIKEIKR